MSYNAGSTMNRVSGLVLPLILRQKLQQRRDNDNDDSAAATIIKATIDPLTKTPASADDRNRTCTADYLEDELWRSSQALTEVQRQIVKGEEVYYEETQAYGSNIYRGWDGFIDSRDISSHSNSGSMHHLNNRRMPHDFRWFSASAMALTTTRHLKAEPMGSRISSCSFSAATSSSNRSALVPFTSVVPSAVSSRAGSEPTKAEANKSAAATTAAADKDDSVVKKEESVQRDADDATVEDTASKDEGTDDDKADESASESTSKQKRKAKDSAPRRTKRTRRSGA